MGILTFSPITYYFNDLVVIFNCTLVLDKKRDLTGIISKTTHFEKRKYNSLDEFLKMNTTYFRL